MAQLPPLGVATYQVRVGSARRRRHEKAAAGAGAGAAAAALLAPAEAMRRAEALQPQALQPAAEPATEQHAAEEDAGLQAGANVSLSNGILELNFSRATGHLLSMVNLVENLTLQAEQSCC